MLCPAGSGLFCQTEVQKFPSVVPEAARSESDVVSPEALSLTWLSSFPVSAASLEPSLKELITHSVLMVLPSGSPPLIHKLRTPSSRHSTTSKNGF